ncbi:MAG: NFACT family protein [Oscillospiraceae bacterium]|jgi:predicted ribosome quality control (RQC) complex YloA/Tae2 family protein|nr:NFACT family protein [Oscillospiraceae bacterium]
MSLSGAFLHIVKTEMLNEGLIGARIEKIHQPSREEIVLSLHTKSGNKKLLLSANPASARVCLTSRTPENPPVPPMFCQLLRKRLGNGRLVEIAQDGFERIVFFKFHCRNEIGDEEIIILSVEIMGRSNNIILLIEKNGELRVIDALKRIADDVSAGRRVLPGLVYELPLRETRLSLLNFTKPELMNTLKNREHERLDKALIKIFEGICPLFAREAVFHAAGQIDIQIVDLTVDSTESLYNYLENVQNAFKPTMLIDSGKKPYDFTFVDIKQYGELMTVKPFESANALLDSFYAERANNDRLKQRSGAVLKTLKNSYERVLRKIDARKSDLAACAGREKFRKWGDLISANIHNMEKGMDSLVTQDFETGEEARIPLDSKLTPAKNAQKYYAEYKKLQTAEKTLTKLIKDSEDELIYLDSVLEAAERASGDSELLEIKRELIESGYIKSVGLKKGAKQEKPSEPLKFISSDNVNVLVGRNNRQNDLLTFKTAKPREIWLHTKDIAGSHVIVRSENPSEKTLEEAAQLAAWFSKARGSSRVPVDYTEARFVKKPHGAKPGMVIFTNNKTLYVTPSEEVYNKLEEK